MAHGLLDYLNLHKGESLYLVLVCSSYNTVVFSGYAWQVPFAYLAHEVESSVCVAGTDVVVVTYDDERLG